MKITLFYTLLAVLLSLIIIEMNRHYSEQSKSEIEDILFDIVINDTNKVDIHIIDWHLFIDAIMYVESGHNESAVGQTNDAGVLQITPIYVEEANRILGQKKYTLSDRFDRYKSIEMFTVVNERYNPEKSFYKAMRLHNPLAPESYRKAILKQYYKLRQQ